MNADYRDEKAVKNSNIKADAVLARELFILKSQDQMAHILLEDEPTDSLYSDSYSWH